MQQKFKSKFRHWSKFIFDKCFIEIMILMLQFLVTLSKKNFNKFSINTWTIGLNFDKCRYIVVGFIDILLYLLTYISTLYWLFPSIVNKVFSPHFCFFLGEILNFDNKIDRKRTCANFGCISTVLKPWYIFKSFNSNRNFVSI